MNKIYAISILPLLPIAILIDLILGDFVTKVKTSSFEKLKSHKQMWTATWNNTK